MLNSLHKGNMLSSYRTKSRTRHCKNNWDEDLSLSKLYHFVVPHHSINKRQYILLQ